MLELILKDVFTAVGQLLWHDEVDMDELVVYIDPDVLHAVLELCGGLVTE